MRKKPIYLSILSQMPAEQSSKITAISAAPPPASGSCAPPAWIT